MSESRSFMPMQTPKRSLQVRPYLNVHQAPRIGGRTPNSDFENENQMTDEGGIIFGTNITTGKAFKEIQEFITNFLLSRNDERGEVVSEMHYLQKFNDIGMDIGGDIFEIKGTHLKEHSQHLYYQVIYFPAEMISCFDYVLKSLYQRKYINTEMDEQIVEERNAKKERLMMGISHLAEDDITNMRNLSPKDINKLICFRGIVIRCSEIYPEMKAAVFRCVNCRNEVQILLENAKVHEPTQCMNCKGKHSVQIIHNLCTFTDKQFIKFQELPEGVPDGDTPCSMTILAYDNNVDGIRPGDRVEIVGIYRTQGQKVKRSRNALKAIFNTYIDLISFRIIQQDRFQSALGDKSTIFNDQDHKRFAQMADQDTIIDDLVASFAPSIYGHEQIKKGILAQLFSGARKDFSESGRGRFRSDINICLVGDPSTAKSQLLQQVYKIAPRGIYTSGRGSSAVGLTANVRKDPQTRQFVLQSGALVLSDLGICCIDEFDKMDDNSKTILLEAMEQQTISIAKAGIVCQLNSRTAILAAANPVNSKYDTKKSVVENINLIPALLSRFDLIYIVLDRPNENYDRRLASHILEIYSINNHNSSNQHLGKFPRDILAKYITYARQFVNPRISESAGRKMSQYYLEMRKQGNSKKVITATPRQLESLIRISEAFAKMRLSVEVVEEDVERAINLIRVAMQKSATDPTTGCIDMDAILIGRTAKHRDRVNRLKKVIEDILKANTTTYKKSSSIDSLMVQVERLWDKNEDPATEKEVQEAMKFLQTEGVLSLFGQSSKQNFKLTLMD